MPNEFVVQRRRVKCNTSKFLGCCGVVFVQIKDYRTVILLMEKQLQETKRIVVIFSPYDKIVKVVVVEGDEDVFDMNNAFIFLNFFKEGWRWFSWSLWL